MEMIYAIYGNVIIAAGSKEEVECKIRSYGRLDRSKIILTSKPSDVLG